MLTSGVLVGSAPPSVSASRTISLPLPLSSKCLIGGARGLEVFHGGAKPASRITPAGVAVECSSRPQKKSTAGHRKTRPKKSQPWDVKRKGPTVYAPLPSLPPDWSLAASTATQTEVSASS